MKIAVLFFIFVNLYSIDFNTLREYTLENSKYLQVSKLNIDISKTNLKLIDSESFPSFSLGFSSERSKGLNEDLTSSFYVGDNDVSSSSLFKNYFYLSMNYNLYDFGRLKARIEAQNFTIKSKRSEYCIEQKSITEKLLDTYYETRVTLIKDKYLNEILKESNQLYQYYKRLNEIGNIKKSDVVTNAMEIANIYNNIYNNKKTLVENFEKLSNISTYDFKSSHTIEPLIFSSNEIEKKEFYNTQTAKKYLNDIKNKKAELELINASYYPQINIFGKYDYYGFNENSLANSFDNFKENSYKYGFNISWQIFNGFKTKTQERKAIQELKQLNLKLQQAKIDFETQLNTLNKTHKYYTQILNQSTKTLELSNKNKNMALRLNSVGEVDKIFELNTMIKRLYTQMENVQAKETVAYKMIKKSILLNGDEECIVH